VVERAKITRWRQLRWRQPREYEILETLAHHDTFVELLGKNTLSDARRMLRIYSIPPRATDVQRERIIERALGGVRFQLGQDRGTDARAPRSERRHPQTPIRRSTRSSLPW